jgi:hypothetical protein
MIENIPVLQGVQNRDFGIKKMIGTPRSGITYWNSLKIRDAIREKGVETFYNVTLNISKKSKNFS